MEGDKTNHVRLLLLQSHHNIMGAGLG